MQESPTPSLPRAVDIPAHVPQVVPSVSTAAMSSKPQPYTPAASVHHEAVAAKATAVSVNVPKDPRQARLQQTDMSRAAHVPQTPSTHPSISAHTTTHSYPLTQAVPSGSTASVTAPQSQMQQSAAAEVVPNSADMERAQLLLQLVQMPEHQLATLPADQRQVVLMLKEQLARQMAT